MTGGSLQLTAYGAQDIYLTSNPQISFFKVIYHRHTNFAMESFELPFNGATPTLGKSVVSTVTRSGDLLMGLWLEMTFTVNSNEGIKYAAYCLGYACIKSVSLEIGGQQIDKHYGEWLNIYTELTTPAGKLELFDRMIGRKATIINGVPYGPESGDGVSKTHMLNVPLQFWFCRNAGLALPVICLAFHEVKIYIEFENADNIAGNSNGITMDECKLWADYVYLDTEERRRIATNTHEYLFECLQLNECDTVDSIYRKYINLHFNHCVKEIIWTIKENNNVVNSNPCGPYSNLAETAKIRFNGQDRFALRDKSYFLDVQQYKHHTHGARIENFQYYYVYSFALNPEQHQPSGACNFSRIDNVLLELGKNGGFSASKIKIYAVHYDVLRVMSGMAGCAFRG